ncbi:TPA: hypothetical protein QDB60_003343, partial [Burkholderia multivorans]|nr:hypothetical protein [Burkholderia multivorans]
PASGAAPSAPGAAVPPASAPAPGSAVASAPPAASVPAAAPAQQQTHAGYRNIDEFVVTYQRTADGTRYAAIFHRFGLFSWKLSAIDLHA